MFQYLIENRTKTTYQMLKLRNFIVFLENTLFDASNTFQYIWDRAMFTTVLHHLRLTAICERLAAGDQLMES